MANPIARDDQTLVRQLAWAEGYAAAVRALLSGGLPSNGLPAGPARKKRKAPTARQPDLTEVFAEQRAAREERPKRRMSAKQRAAISAGRKRGLATQRRKVRPTGVRLAAMQRNAALARAAKARMKRKAKKPHWTQTAAGRRYFASPEGRAKQRAANLALQAKSAAIRAS